MTGTLALGAAYPKEIVAAIAKVMAADTYIQKRGENPHHHYKYAKVGDVLDKLQPLMADAGLVVLQHEIGSEFLSDGAVLAVRYEFTLAHISGAVWPSRPVLTGMSRWRDSKGGIDDKAENKCHTAARKYFLLALFQVPTGDEPDADAEDTVPPSQPAASVPAEPAAPSISPEKKQAAREARDRIRRAVAAADAVQVLDDLVRINRADLDLIKEAGPGSYDVLMADIGRRRSELTVAAAQHQQASGPHEIPMADLSHRGTAEWRVRFVSAIAAARTADEVIAWRTENAAVLEVLHKQAPSEWSDAMGAVAAKIGRLGHPPRVREPGEDVDDGHRAAAE